MVDLAAGKTVTFKPVLQFEHRSILHVALVHVTPRWEAQKKKGVFGFFEVAVDGSGAMTGKRDSYLHLARVNRTCNFLFLQHWTGKILDCDLTGLLKFVFFCLVEFLAKIGLKNSE